MKVFCLYYKDNFVVSFPNREDCVNYGKKHYEGMEWDCSIIVKYLHDVPFYTSTSPFTPLIHSRPYLPQEQNIPVPRFTVDYTQPPKVN